MRVITAVRARRYSWGQVGRGGAGKRVWVKGIGLEVVQYMAILCPNVKCRCFGLETCRVHWVAEMVLAYKVV